jgi:hypothetical protein
MEGIATSARRSSSARGISALTLSWSSVTSPG